MKSPSYVAAAFLLSSSAVGSPNGQSVDSASEHLAAAFENANEIEIAHTSRYVIFRTPTKLSKDDVSKGWRVKIAFRCIICSRGETPAKFARLIRKSVNVSNSCGDFRSRITARNERGEIIATAWGDVSGRCIETNAGAFVLEGNYWDFVDSELAPPR